MPKKIVYIINSLYEEDFMSQVLGKRINWLAENTDYEIAVFLTEGKKKKENIVNLSPKVQVTNLALNFNNLKDKSLLTRWILRWIKQKKYKAELTKYLKKESPQIIISLSGHEWDFFHRIKTNGFKMLELHEDIDHYTDSKLPFLPRWGNEVVKMFKLKMLKQQLKGINGLVADTYELMINWSMMTNDIKVIHNPIINAIVERKPGNNIVLAIGDFIPSSGYEILIGAWERIISRYPQWRLRLYGNGDMEPYKKIIKKKRLSKSVYCYPMGKDMATVFAKSALYIHTLSKDKFGRRIMEAQSYGLPCIAFNTPYGPKDLIENEKNGFLSFDEHIADLSAKMGLLIRNQEFRDQMGMHAQESCKAYLLDPIMEKWVKLFEKILQSDRT